MTMAEQLLAFREAVAAEVLHEGGNSNHCSTVVYHMEIYCDSEVNQNKCSLNTKHHRLMKLQQEDQVSVSLLTNYYNAD